MVQDPNNTPSFIPKEEENVKIRGHIERIRRYLNAFLMIGVLLFVAAVVGALMSYLYVNYSDKELENRQSKLRDETSEADAAEIAKLNRFDTRLKAAEELLDNHREVSPVLAEIENHTLEVVQLLSASIAFSDSGNLSVSGEGEAKDYMSLATQSDAFSESDYISNPIFSTFQQNEDGFVSFVYSFEVSKDLISPVVVNNQE